MGQNMPHFFALFLVRADKKFIAPTYQIVSNYFLTTHAHASAQ
jgi:hypothetical protein